MELIDTCSSTMCQVSQIDWNIILLYCLLKLTQQEVYVLVDTHEASLLYVVLLDDKLTKKLATIAYSIYNKEIPLVAK